MFSHRNRVWGDIMGLINEQICLSIGWYLRGVLKGYVNNVLNNLDKTMEGRFFKFPLAHNGRIIKSRRKHLNRLKVWTKVIKYN